MGKMNLANIKKTVFYLKRNGIRNTLYAVKERMEGTQRVPYSYCPVSEQELEKQREWASDKKVVFSIVVPTFRTNELYLKEMIQSVQDQTYPHWELILADATPDDSVGNAVQRILADCGQQTEGIVYIKLEENAGIAANTNQGLAHVSGDYVGLLDHDDVLTPDALYEVAQKIEKAQEQGKSLQMIYSDEDKCNGDRTLFYELHRKEDFNLDLLLSNNYICHFLVMKKELIQSLGFRPAYDGAQDYDLVLRAVGKIRDASADYLSQQWKEQISHIPKVLYHWRCHTGSTAENPQSKQYAYDAGLRALQDFADTYNWKAKAVHLKHLGFYALEYPEGILESRRDLAAVGGRVLGKIRYEVPDDGPTSVIGDVSKAKCHSGTVIIGGRMSPEGDVYYEGLPANYSGLMHRAVLTQNADAVDIRCLRVRKECWELFEQVVGVPYVEICDSAKGKESEQIARFDDATLPAGADYKEVSLQLGKALRKAGYEILYCPAWEKSRQ